MHSSSNVILCIHSLPRLQSCLDFIALYAAVEEEEYIDHTIAKLSCHRLIINQLYDEEAYADEKWCRIVS